MRTKFVEMALEVNNTVKLVSTVPSSGSAWQSTTTKLQTNRTAIKEQRSTIEHMLHQGTLDREAGDQLTGFLDELLRGPCDSSDKIWRERSIISGFGDPETDKAMIELSQASSTADSPDSDVPTHGKPLSGTFSKELTPRPKRD